MQRFLAHCSRRFGYSGWGLMVRGAIKPMQWSACTTRAEARALRKERFADQDMFDKIDVVKIKITVELA